MRIPPAVEDEALVGLVVARYMQLRAVDARIEQVLARELGQILGRHHPERPRQKSTLSQSATTQTGSRPCVSSCTKSRSTATPPHVTVGQSWYMQ